MDGDPAENADSQRKENTLNAVHVRHRAEPPGGDIDYHHCRQGKHAEVHAHQPVCQHVEQVSGCPQLNAEIWHAEQKRHQHGEKANGVSAVVVAVHLSRRNVVKRPPQHPLTPQEKHACKRDRQRIERGKCVGEAVGEDLARVPHERPSTETGGRSGKHKYPHADGSPRQKIVGRGAGAPRALDPPEKTVSPVEAYERHQPYKLGTHRRFLPSELTGSLPDHL